MTPTVTAAHLALAETLADAAGEIIRGYFRKNIGVEQKSDRTPVTIADRGAEKIMRRLIEIAFPLDGIVGEEFGAQRADADYVWVLDPIDGTKSFISGVPLFGTLIALTYRGSPVLGVIDQPVLRERWIGAAGRKTIFNGRAIATRRCASLGAATLFATAPEMFAPRNTAAFNRLRAKVKLARFGADCYAYGLLASGFIDLVVEASLKPHDFCALLPIVEGAGGKMRDWQGRALTLESDGRVIASGDPKLLAKAQTVLARR
ncbi:MAG TPA: histidinol-phosphatase [Stellaceae bacterium]|jgi:inositol-phosphate phosphatase/L-galactose 1-phosphate phosphatase/histidinol-phosphatase|nr:histidinol-phosphatase [Stellaceae bacterium]